ncbi:MAG: GerMN domain-containing protein [Thermoanaerobaculia bacterium]
MSSGTQEEAATQNLDGPIASIYFPATSGLLEPELRPAPAGLDRAERTFWLAEQVVAGPQTSGLRPALPAGTEVASVFAAPSGTVFVDFTLSGETAGMGSRDELLALYSVINTILGDDENAERVVILINGRQRETLAGHVDTSQPLAARPDLIREAG